MAIAQAATVTAMRGSAGDDKTRLVLELDASVDFRARLMDIPPRLVIEMPVAQVETSVTNGLTHLGIKDVAQQQNGKLLRLDLTLKQPVKIVSAFMLPRDGPRPDRLVIDYRAVSKADFAIAIKDSFGTLQSAMPLAKTDAPPPVAEDGILGTLTRASNPLPTPVPGAPKTTPPQPSAIVDEPSNDAVDAPRAPRRYIIAIDAGHGGKDPGAIGVRGVQEKNITLAAAKELSRQLEESGRYKTILTRNTDRFILLPDRVKIARAAGADLFVSLHADMAGENHSAAGLSIYTLSDKASDEQTERLAAKENKVDLLAGIDLSGAQEDVANILIDLAMRENMNQSRFFAGKIVKSMGEHHIDLLEKPHRYAGFAVLKAPDIPSVLVEMGFLSNTVEAKRLQDQTHRKNLMHGLKQGIDTYFDYLEKNTQM